MDPTTLAEYLQYLQRQTAPATNLAECVALAEDFSCFLSLPQVQKMGTGKEQVEQFARERIETGRNTPENFRLLADFTNWLYLTKRLPSRELYVAWIEVMDCHKALEVLADHIEDHHGQEARQQVFPDPLPPLGASEAERCGYTRAIAARLEQTLAPNAVRDAWFQVQHGIPPERWQQYDPAEREMYRQCASADRGASIDAFLDRKRQERDVLLTRLRDEHALWYTVEIDDEVLEYVMSDPEMEVGQRQGNQIFFSKIPYNAKRYLHEHDPRLKRYYACHCPLLREAIRAGQPISAEVCRCSLGHASHYLAGLGLELKGEVLESAVRGDPRCRFVFTLPDEEGQDL